MCSLNLNQGAWWAVLGLRGDDQEMVRLGSARWEMEEADKMLVMEMGKEVVLPCRGKKEQWVVAHERRNRALAEGDEVKKEADCGMAPVMMFGRAWGGEAWVEEDDGELGLVEGSGGHDGEENNIGIRVVRI